MKSQRRLWWRLALGLALIGGVYAFQRPFRVYRSMEPYDDIPLAPDWEEKTEWVQARLMYPNHPNARFSNWSALSIRASLPVSSAICRSRVMPVSGPRIRALLVV